MMMLMAMLVKLMHITIQLHQQMMMTMIIMLMIMKTLKIIRKPTKKQKRHNQINKSIKN